MNIEGLKYAINGNQNSSDTLFDCFPECIKICITIRSISNNCDKIIACDLFEYLSIFCVANFNNFNL